MDNFLTEKNNKNLIARAHQRSQKYGLSVANQADPCVLTPGELDALQEQQQRLLAHLKQLEPLFNQLQGNEPSRLLFANAQGVILYSAGSQQFHNKAQKIALAPGAVWHEQNMGTNAIGTALCEQIDLCVFGSEHFIKENQQISCSASPVFSPQGELLGVIDISSEVQHHNPNMLFSAQLLAQALENTLLSEQEEVHWLLNLAESSASLHLPWAGLLTLDAAGQLIGANRIAKRWLDNLNLDKLFTQLRQGELTPLGKGVALLNKIAPKKPTHRSSNKPSQKSSLQEDFDKALKLLNAGMPLFVHGETGVGKDYLVRQLHQHSRFKQAPLVAVNCGALPSELIEAELFGYQAGAFTGSSKQGRLGYIRGADGGILFLDEIGELPLSAQARLLRVLQEKAVTPLGCHKPIPVEFTVIAASHKNLQGMVEEGSFRQDLFFRLCAYQVTLPPLRQLQAADLRLLITHLLLEINADTPIKLSPEVWEKVLDYSWPGNIRQLKQSLEVASILAAGDTIELSHLPNLPELNDSTGDDSGANNDLRQNQHQHIEKALAACNGNISAAARQLGISRTTIYNYLRR